MSGPLLAVLRQAMGEHGCSMKDLTVLSQQRDPFRLDTPARHRDGQWLAETARELGLGDRRIHLRGLHYMVIGRPKPTSGLPYENTDKDWIWLSEEAGKAARFLGYLPFEQIVDQRNADPVVYEFSRADPWAYLTVGVDVEIPRASEIMPKLGVQGFDGTQSYHLVMIGEKSSLGDVLGPLAQTYRADLYLPTGEPSDTMLHRMARSAATDGRPMAVLYFSDCDPSGWTMPLSVSRKLQAFKTLYRDMPEFEVYRVALTPSQVQEHGLPSTPLKESEARGDKWREAFGISQTEIDSLASLRPDLLRRIARDALDPFFDHTLDQRVFEAQGRWMDTALAIVNSELDGERLGQIRRQAEEQLAGMRAQIQELNDQLRIDIDDFNLPSFEIPEPQPNGHRPPAPLLDSRWPFAEQCRRLIDSKQYRTGGEV